jgi:hypothetical protein
MFESSGTSNADYRPELSELTTTEGTPATRLMTNTGFQRLVSLTAGP